MRNYDRILAECGYPTVFLASEEQFIHVEGDKIGSEFGSSAVTYPAIYIKKGLRGKVQINTLWHELLHVLFPSWPHWKVEAAAQKMARGGGIGYYCERFGHSVNEMPSREELLKRIQRQVKIFNKKWRNRYVG